MRLCMIQILLSCTISGCNDTSSKGTQVDETIIEVQEATENSQENAEEIINICIDLYKKAAEEDVYKRQVQDLLDFSKPAQHVYVCVFPENEKTYCIISWFKKNDGMFSSYYEQLNGLDEVKKRNFINNLLPMISENLVVNPEAWEKLSPSQKNEFGSYVWGMETIAQEMGIKVDRTEAPSYDMFEL